MNVQKRCACGNRENGAHVFLGGTTEVHWYYGGCWIHDQLGREIARIHGGMDSLCPRCKDGGCQRRWNFQINDDARHTANELCALRTAQRLEKLEAVIRDALRALSGPADEPAARSAP